MPEITLPTEPNRTTGSRAARRLRRAGRTPGVVYGHGLSATPISVDARALRSAFSTPAGLNVVLELELDGTRHLAMAKAVQRHPTRGTVAHVDFLVVRRDEVVTVEVPVMLEGSATEVSSAGGVVEQQLFMLSVRATPDRIPARLSVDISALSIGTAVRVGDIVLPEGVATTVDAETVVVAGQQAQREEVPVEAVAEEAAEEAAAEGAEGAEAAGEASGAGTAG